MSNTCRVNVSALTHVGKVRQKNEDAICSSKWVRNKSMDNPRVEEYQISTARTFVVADGVGGQNAGEIASQLAVNALSRVEISLRSPAAIRSELQRVNRFVYSEADRNPNCLEMGTTIAGISVLSDRIYWFNVGDSRIYRYRDGFLRQLSVDDVSIYRDRYGGERRLLTQSIGGTKKFRDVDPHIGEEPIEPGWTYLLCSDGLTDMVTTDSIELAMDRPTEGQLQSLFSLAMEAGGRDNISIITVSVQLKT